MHMRNSTIKMNLPRGSRDRALMSVTTSAVITGIEPIAMRIAAIVFDLRFLFCVLPSLFKKVQVFALEAIPLRSGDLIWGGDNHDAGMSGMCSRYAAG
jgi:hypothetical protein